MAKLTFTVPDMMCAACAETITQAIQVLDATATVDADPNQKVVTVTTTAAAEQVSTAINQAGYTIQ
ncbi:MAG: heavy-metal-associated domain-containing protein [Leptolyngbyaceae cyanobacterium]